MPLLPVVRRPVVKLFNAFYHVRHATSPGRRRWKFEEYFYPLDAIRGWNRLYGKSGFFQHQSVVPRQVAGDCLPEMLRVIEESGQGSMLTVLKTFGSLTSGGMLSFPRPGVTLAVDFANLGAQTLTLLDRLDRIVMEARGAIYPAKDARMSVQCFASSFPRAEAFSRYVDPGFSSSFWRRVTQ